MDAYFANIIDKSKGYQLLLNLYSNHETRKAIPRMIMTVCGKIKTTTITSASLISDRETGLTDKTTPNHIAVWMTDVQLVYTYMEETIWPTFIFRSFCKLFKTI